MKIRFFDGAMGSMLISAGLSLEERPELLNLTSPENISAIHRMYVSAGAEFITANTFGANRINFPDSAQLEEVVARAVAIAKDAARERDGVKVALDVGSLGVLLEPSGELTFEEAYSAFAEVCVLGEKYGAELVLVETVSDLGEARAAVLAARENTALPVIASMTFTEGGRTVFGTPPEAAAAALAAAGASVIGANCSMGPDKLLDVARVLVAHSPVPVLIQANAGMPQSSGDGYVYPVGADEYSDYAVKLAELGVRYIGGCCGTTPEYTEKIVLKLAERDFPEVTAKIPVFASSDRQAVADIGVSRVIGERINPTGKKKLKAALQEGDLGYVAGEATSQEAAGAEILDVNCGVPGINEVEVLPNTVKMLRSVTPLPLMIDSSSPEAIEAALRVYNGKAIVNSVNGGEESLSAILPLVRKYGTAVVSLTLDGDGIPDTVEGRVAIAERIISRCDALGIPRRDILVDCLTMAAAASEGGASVTLRAISEVKRRFGVKTVLGVSNVSFGLPRREIVGSAFLSEAYGAGLDFAIINPLSEDFMRAVTAHRVLDGSDRSAGDYIAKYSGTASESVPSASVAKPKENAVIKENRSDLLYTAILTGDQSGASRATEAALSPDSADAGALIESSLIPALDEVGRLYGLGVYFLPQLISSAEAAKASFSVISAKRSVKAEREAVIMATVEGDVHDIGKNIVSMMLENYGYRVIDLGKNVPPEAIVEAAVNENVRLVGLSALMTVSLKPMGETVARLREKLPDCRVVVGGAVLNEEYARSVGADKYARDAAQTVRYANEIFGH